MVVRAVHCTLDNLRNNRIMRSANPGCTLQPCGSLKVGHSNISFPSADI